MASMDGVGHPLSLKVMRVSRPSLAPQWQPFFSSSTSFSAHATANALSLQGSEPLAGNPKTLRDLSHAGQMLMLPAAFGAIQLGETFSCCLAVNNETVVDVDDVTVKVEMQTATSKATLAEIGRKGNVVRSKDTLETVVHHEIKELGQHVLACSVTYRTPPGMRPVTSGSENAGDPFLQTFRKFYKFAVTNPLSVKTKVHVPRSPSALLSRSERDKVFLEVHIQNLTQGPLWFEKLRLEPVEGWDAIDANNLSVPVKQVDGQPDLFSGTTAIMQPQDIRQYVYIMTPKAASSSTSVPVPPAPGSIIPLGRLDISWHSSMGEPGRLLTSVLSRKIPLLPQTAVAPASALPPYLQKPAHPGQVARPQSPSALQQQQRVATPPPQRPGSPLKRISTPGIPTRPGSPALNQPPLPPLPGTVPARADIEVDLVVLSKPDNSTVRSEQLFQLQFALSVSAVLPRPSAGAQERKTRIVTLAVQHLLPTPPQPAPPPPPRELKRRTSTMISLDQTPALSPQSGSIDTFTPRGILSPPPGTGTPGGKNYIGTPDKVMSPVMESARNLPMFGVGGLTEKLRNVAISDGQQPEGTDGESFGGGLGGQPSVHLPPPYSTIVKEPDAARTGHVTFLGTSITTLPPLTFSSQKIHEDLSATITAETLTERGEEIVEFSLNFIGSSTGFAHVGGLRVLLISDKELADDLDGKEGDEAILHSYDYQPSLAEARVLREWDVVAEVWVT